MSEITIRDHAETWVEGVSHLLIGADPYDDENLRDTPRRVAEAFREMLYGHSEAGKRELTRLMETRFKSKHQELVAVVDIRVSGMCPHHFLPVLYSISIGYVPSKTVLGLSKLPRIARILASRAIMQEDLTTDVADMLYENLEAQGVGVVVKAFHTCMSIRGAHAREAITLTSAMRGLMLDNDKGVKDEFMRLVLQTGGQFPWQ